MATSPITKSTLIKWGRDHRTRHIDRVDYEKQYLIAKTNRICEGITAKQLFDWIKRATDLGLKNANSPPIPDAIPNKSSADHQKENRVKKACSTLATKTRMAPICAGGRNNEPIKRENYSRKTTIQLRKLFEIYGKRILGIK